MFDQPTVDQLAEALAKRLAQSDKPKQPERWPELMTIETAAKYMDRTPSAIQNLIEAKLLPVCRIDRRVQIRRVDLDRVIERKTA